MKNAVCGADCTQCCFSNGCTGCADKNCFISKYISIGGEEKYREFKNGLIEEINSLNILGMNKLNDLCPLVGSYVNLEYTLPNGEKTKFLKDDEIYLGMQTENSFAADEPSCFGVIANAEFILVCQYVQDAKDAQLLLYRRR